MSNTSNASTRQIALSHPASYFEILEVGLTTTVSAGNCTLRLDSDLIWDQVRSSKISLRRNNTEIFRESADGLDENGFPARMEKFMKSFNRDREKGVAKLRRLAWNTGTAALRDLRNSQANSRPTTENLPPEDVIDDIVQQMRSSTCDIMTGDVLKRYGREEASLGFGKETMSLADVRGLLYEQDDLDARDRLDSDMRLMRVTSECLVSGFKSFLTDIWPRLKDPAKDVEGPLTDFLERWSPEATDDDETKALEALQEKTAWESLLEDHVEHLQEKFENSTNRGSAWEQFSGRYAF